MKVKKPRVKPRTALMILGVIVFACATYLFIIPTVVAIHYLNQLDAETGQAKTELRAVSSGSTVAIFEDPDIKLDERQKYIDKALGQIRQTQKSLDNLQNANKLAALPGNGFAGRYHKATIRQERINNIIRQSHQVLDEYVGMLAYTGAHTEAQLYLERQLVYINDIRDFNTLAGQGGKMAAIAAELRTHRQRLAEQTPPPALAPLHTDTLQTLDQAAASFDRLGYGLNQRVNSDIYGAVTILEQIALKIEVDDKQMMTELAQKSPSLLQLADLPEKIDHALQL